MKILAVPEYEISEINKIKVFTFFSFFFTAKKNNNSLHIFTKMFIFYTLKLVFFFLIIFALQKNNGTILLFVITIFIVMV